jgi:flagellar basal-body rod modification protein FlgD
MDYMSDISALYSASGMNTTPTHSTSKSSGDTLNMTDYLELMVCELQNQTIDNTADTSEMVNQLVQMQVVQSITDITNAINSLYSTSLVGKEVTIGQYDTMGNLEQTVGTVTGVGYSNEEPIIFVGDKSYSLSAVMAVGRLPSTLDISEDLTSLLQTNQAENTTPLYKTDSSIQSNEEDTEDTSTYEVENVTPSNETQDIPTTYELEDVTANVELDEVG